ncbi:unnamed protein product [Medioppia subpectinata]|uniref:Pericentrin/AKAP-450 centrosomal targeting domain-containing protein n=1 Tax=Medioppia subpectinata TaxID=1979941 RepID=A0A7R9KDS3_9ACAR|nr:unnamed protein product [Medioppia subpectinata]CAG2101665.1 unnamed protein product [Medioppia subpectinata]
MEMWRNEDMSDMNIYDMNDDSVSISEANVLQLNQTLRQREAVIKQLSERLQTTLKSRDDITETAETMAQQVQELRSQLKLMSTSLLHKAMDGQPSPALHDFQCQTEWTEDNSFSVEEPRRLSQSLLSVDTVPHGLKTLSSVSESTYLGDNSVQTESDLHLKCRQELERLEYNLMVEFNEREKRIESTLSERVNQLQQQMVSDRNSYLDTNRKLDEEIDRLKSYITELEDKQKSLKMNGDHEIERYTKTRINESSSPVSPFSPFLQNITENELHLRSTSRSPIFQTLQKYVAQTPIENSRLLHVLSDLVKTFIDTEHDIQKHLIDMGIENRVTNKEELLQSFVSINDDVNERLEETNELCEDGPDLTPNSNAVYYTPPSGQNEVEEDVVLGASRRLRTAVDRILKLLSEVLSAQHEHDYSSVAKKNEELLSELNEECVRRNKLTTQLFQIEDRVKSLEKEKSTLSENLIDYNEMKRQLETTRAKLNEYELERDKWMSDNKRLEDEKSSFAQGLPQLQKKLVDDNESLNSDVLQLQQERIKLLQRIHALTLESETLRSERDDILDDKRRECEDFVAQIEANEKNILSYRKFIDEQTHERELERDEYHKELVALNERLKDKEKSESKLRSRLEEMETQMSCLTEEKCFKEKQLDGCSHQLKTANNDISELKAIIDQMERESDKSSQSEKKLRSKIDGLNEALELQIRINEESQNDVLANNLLEQITSKTHLLQNSLGSAETESEDTSLECSYTDVALLRDKLNDLNECIDKLLVQNKSLKNQLELIRSEKNIDYDELVKEKQSLERNLTEIYRSNEILKDELNTKHLQLSSLKSRLESSLDSSDMKHMFEEMQNKLISEEQKNKKFDFELISLKQQIDDKNDKSLQLMDELNAIKRQFKAIDSEKCSLVRENDELRLKLSSKDAILVAIKQKSDEKGFASKQLIEQIDNYKQTIETIESEKLKLIQMNEELKSKFGANEMNVNSMRQRMEEIEIKESKYLETTESLSRKLKVLNRDKSHLTKENAELKANLSSVNAVLLSLTEQVDQKNAKTLQLMAKMDSLSNKLKTIESEKVKSLKENEEMKLKLNHFEKHIHDLKCQISEEQIKSLRLIEEIESLKCRLKVIESEKDRLLKENSSLKAKLNSNDEIVILLKQQLEEKNNKIKHLNELIDKMKNNFLRFESDNRERREKSISSSGKIFQIHSEKAAEEDERLNGVSSQLLWRLKRVMSQKNALIHQKKYLLHVLGGFQLTEKATLALLANMNVTVDDELPAYQSGKNRFRSAVYCVIAISRMKLLVRKWKFRNHLKSSKSSVAKTVSTNSLGATNELQTDSTLQEFVNRLQRLHDTLGLRTGQI